MVDEVKIPTKEELLAPEEIQDEVVTPVAPELSDEEVRAQESGWVPKEQWKGDPDAWRPAKEFNERGELFNRIKQQSKDISELRQAMTFLTNQQRKQYFQGFNDAITQLKARRDAALEEGDLVAAQRINDKIDEHKEVLREQKQVAVATPPVQAQPTQTFFSWADKNPWYTKDRKMTHFADAVGLSYKEENPDATEAEMLRHVSNEVKERFPEKFQQARGAPSPDGDGRGVGRQQSKSSYSSVESSMPEDHRQMMKTIMKATGMSKEEYLKSYGTGR
jgi:hypothetical protein